MDGRPARRRPRCAALASLAVVVAVTGCGSTVAVGSRAVVLGTEAPSLGAGPGQDGTLSVTPPPGSDAGGGTTGTHITAPGGRPGAPQPSAPTVTTTGGVTHLSRPIRVGYSYSSDQGAFFASIGVAAGGGDIRQQMKIVAADINSHGGLLGQRIELFPVDIKFADVTTNMASAMQAACTQWTEDYHVDVVLDTAELAYEAVACLAQHHTPYLGNQPRISQHEIDRYRPYVYGSSAMTVEDYMPVWADRLVAQGYFRGWNTSSGNPGTAPVKIGIMYYEGERDYRFAQAIKAALAAHGYRIAPQDEITYSYDVSQQAAVTQQAVLKFKADHVTHVINANLFFYQGAERERYRPRYAVDTSLGPGSGAAAGVIPAKQWHGALGAGYAPILDVDPDGHSPPREATTSATARCRALMAKNGQPSQEADACDLGWFYEALVRAAGALDGPSLERGLARVGRSFTSVFTFTTLFRPGREAGAAAVRDLAFIDSCSCFEYTSRTLYPVR